MNDDNWELINGSDAHHIEQLNAANTINAIEGLLVFLRAESKRLNVSAIPSDAALKELHRTGTIFLLKAPGRYRQENVVLKRRDGIIAYTPPDLSEVDQWMARFFDELQEIWHNGDALDAAAFALWRLNWVHPFKNGNGRTARAFCYTCLCARLGVISLPGKDTIIDQIMASRDVYEACLRDGDKAAANGDRRNLKSMRAYLDGLLQKQIQSSAI